MGDRAQPRWCRSPGQRAWPGQLSAQCARREAELRRAGLGFWPSGVRGAPRHSARVAWRSAAIPSLPRALAGLAQVPFAMAAPPTSGLPRTPGWAHILRSGGARPAGRRPGPRHRAPSLGHVSAEDTRQPRGRGSWGMGRERGKPRLQGHWSPAVSFLFVYELYSAD